MQNKKVVLNNLTPRLYQETILATAIKKNTLVVLPTGMGKSILFVLLAAHRLNGYPQSKVLILAPTKPLCQQHLQTMNKFLRLADENETIEEKTVLLTGQIKPEKRQELWEKAQIIVSTPQGLENDLINKRLDLEDVSLIVFDEAHRAVKDYSYVWIAKQYWKKANYARILGLTASPGSKEEVINEVIKNMHIEEIEVRTDEDPDVKPYIQEVKIDYVKVKLPEEMKLIKKFLEKCYKTKLEEVKKYGYANTINLRSKKDLLGLQAQLQGELAQGNKDFNVLKSISLVAEAIKVQHALELLETQGLGSLKKYLEKINQQVKEKKSKAVQNLIRDMNFRIAQVKINKLNKEKVEHPKINKIQELVKEELNQGRDKIIAFTQYRDSAVRIKKELEKIERQDKQVKAEIFVGQAKKEETGLSQKEQIEMLKRFRQGEFNILICTSVGEEGLDIPKVDTVVFYEPIPSAIRWIQRRGRTGRQEKGRMIVLVTEETRDVGYRWSAFHKEKRMFRLLNKLKNKNIHLPRKKRTLMDYAKEKRDEVKIIADHREKDNPIIKHLLGLEVEVELKQLEQADYLLSSRCGVEYKTSEDFVNSLIDGRLFNQLKSLKKTFTRPVVIVEQERDIYSIRNVHPNAIRGMMATIALSYGIPLLFTKDAEDSAALLKVMAKREQSKEGSEFSMHADRKPIEIREQQEYLVSALPEIGLNLAKELLKKFGSVKKVFDAGEEELKEVEKIGGKKARKIRDVLEEEYKERWG